MFYLILEGWRIAPGFARGGKSELHRARCHVTPVDRSGIHVGAWGNARVTESATENKPPGNWQQVPGKGEKAG